MYAVIYAYQPLATEPHPHRKTTAGVQLIGVADTLEAAQEIWDKNFGVLDYVPHTYLGILTPDGLLNYHGEALKGGGGIRAVEARIGVFDD